MKFRGLGFGVPDFELIFREYKVQGIGLRVDKAPRKALGMVAHPTSPGSITLLPCGILN